MHTPATVCRAPQGDEVRDFSCQISEVSVLVRRSIVGSGLGPQVEPLTNKNNREA